MFTIGSKVENPRFYGFHVENKENIFFSPNNFLDDGISWKAFPVHNLPVYWRFYETFNLKFWFSNQDQIFARIKSLEIIREFSNLENRKSA